MYTLKEQKKDDSIRTLLEPILKPWICPSCKLDEKVCKCDWHTCECGNPCYRPVDLMFCSEKYSMEAR